MAVLEVDDSFFYVNRGETVFSLVRRVPGHRILRWHRAATAALITAAMITAAAMGWMSMLNAALLATGLMLISGCLTLRVAARSIDYSTLGVLAAAIGVAAAVSESGLAAVIADGLNRLGAGDPLAALAVVFLGRVVMTNLITNAASAVFMFPIALSMADQLGVSFMPFAIALMTGTDRRRDHPGRLSDQPHGLRAGRILLHGLRKDRSAPDPAGRCRDAPADALDLPLLTPLVTVLLAMRARDPHSPTSGSRSSAADSRWRAARCRRCESESR